MTLADKRLDSAAITLQHKGYDSVQTQAIANCVFCNSPASLEIIALGVTACPSCAARLAGRMLILSNQYSKV